MKINKRHLAKTFSWRIIGTCDTLFLSWFITGSWEIGLAIGGIEVITKMILYYLHERVWFRSKISNANKRHIIKTFSWRLTGTIDTMIIAFLLTGNPITGIKIGGFELITKMILYFIHEKLWYKINYGINNRI